MKKKFLSLILCTCFLIPCAFFMGGCKKEEDSLKRFTELGNNDMLCVEDQYYYTNYQESTTEAYELTYTAFITLTLQRDLNKPYNYNSVYYNNYYYYWVPTTQQNTITLGNITTFTIHTHSYLIYNEDKDIVVKSTTMTTEVADFETNTIVEKTPVVAHKLNSWFTSFEALSALASDLAAIARSYETPSKHFVPSLNGPEYNYTTRTFTDTYYYFS